MKPTLKSPHVIEDDPEKPGHQKINYKASEQFLRMHALGRPDVIYAVKENAYYKNADCTKKFTDEEIQSLGLSLPIEIETKRRKMIDEALKDGGIEAVDMQKIYDATLPGPIELPESIKSKLFRETPEEKIIRRLNRQNLKG